MARRTISMIALAGAVLVLCIGTWMGWPWWANVVAVAALGGFAMLQWYEEFAADPKRIALVATLSAISAVGRAAVQAIPGVQPATFLVLISGYSFGPVVGAAIGGFTAVGSDLFLGEGGWTPWHIVSWGLVGFTAGLLRRGMPRYSTLLLAGFGFLWGYVFDWIMDTWLWLGGSTVNWHTYLVLCISGFWFDTMHAAATGGLVLIAGKAVFLVLERFRRRMVISRNIDATREDNAGTIV